MTKEEIAVLGHAFFDGKTLQRRFSLDFNWIDYECEGCPDFDNGCEWRIKPLEPKTITICTHISANGYLAQSVFGSAAFKSRTEANWTHIKSLDKVVEVG